MSEFGFFIKGLYIGAEQRPPRKDGSSGGWAIGVSVGVDAYKLFSDQAPPADLAISDPITCKVRPRVYKGNLYYNCNGIELG